jgi:hypothetical protein
MIIGIAVQTVSRSAQEVKNILSSASRIDRLFSIEIPKKKISKKRI